MQRAHSSKPAARAGVKHSGALHLLALLGVSCGVLSGSAASFTVAAQERIPAAEVTALDGRKVVLPRDLPGVASVLILGFTRKSVEPTTAWEKATRTSLVSPPDIGFYDLAMLAEVPGFARGWVMHLIKNKVPDVLKPNFVPLMKDEAAWKRAAGFDEKSPDDAYVLLVDRSGAVRWSTHEPWTPERFALMATQARNVANEAR